MSMSAVNRTILAVIGIALLLGGLLVLAGGLDLYGRLNATMPDGWPFTSPHQPVLSAATRADWSDQAWFWPVVIAVPAVVVVGALGWLYAQLHRAGSSTVTVPVPGGEGVALRMRKRALQDAVETEVIDLPRVDKVTVRASGASHRLLLRSTVRLEPGADTARLVRTLDDGPLENARTSLGLAELPCRLRLTASVRRRSAGPKARRVV
ncbi:alkaline shock response membrane anchor protein AmaP [Kitasatospora arboriphila]|uniref:Alkaline shock response membrane anchor protein AmaP n=1 Tax=Kitasatospora arboriphila TaxID=258052 RepID=A0ABP4DVX9_9ACTN